MENKDYEDTIAKDYKIVQELGSGGQAYVYLVEEIGTGLLYAAKISNDLDSIENEIRLTEKVSSIKPPNPYIIKFIKKGKNANYFLLEYAKNGNLFKYIDEGGGFGEKAGKLLAQKILLGVQACHQIGVFHLDLKLENILLDDKHNPKICDFGLGTDEAGFINKDGGTANYKPPQLFKGEKYTGEKNDVFYLGSLLFAIVTGCTCFQHAKEDDSLYKFIKDKEIEKYKEKILKIFSYLSQDFLELITSMIAYEENDRPSVNDILKNKWFDDIKNKKDSLEKGLNDLFLKKEQIIRNSFQQNSSVSTEECYSYGDYRNIDKENEIFPKNIKPKKKDIELGIECFIKIKGKLNYYEFMNNFVNEVKTKFEDNCNVEAPLCQKSFICDFNFEIDNDNSDNNLDLALRNNGDNTCDIQVELFELGKEEYILRFLRTKGALNLYYSKVKELILLAKNFI